MCITVVCLSVRFGMIVFVFVFHELLYACITRVLVFLFVCMVFMRCVCVVVYDSRLRSYVVSGCMCMYNVCMVFIMLLYDYVSWRVYDFVMRLYACGWCFVGYDCA